MRSAARVLIPMCILLVAGSATLQADDQQARDLTWSPFAEIRFRPEHRDNADLNDDNDDVRRQGFMRLRLGLRMAWKEDYRLVLQIQDARVAGEEASTTSNEKNLDLHQGFVEWVTGSGKRTTWTLGRQEWKYGDERMIGPFGWDNIGRSFDGLKVRHARTEFWIDVLFAQTTLQKVTATDPTIVATDSAGIYGVYTQSAPRAGSEYEGYLLGYDDDGGAGETGAIGTTRIHALGARARDRFGRFDYGIEAVYEEGEYRGDDLTAHAAGAVAGLTWGGGIKVRTFGGYDLATGDEDPTDGERQEFFNFFPTNHPHYGYMDYEGWRNLRSYYGGVSAAGGRHFGLVKAHHFALEDERGPWKDAGGGVLGFDAAGASGRSVGGEIDLLYRWAWKEKAVLEAGYGHFVPGQFARRTRGEDPSDWAYVMLTVGF